MEKKVGKLEQVKRKLKQRGSDQSLVRYLFSKEKMILEKNMQDKMGDFIVRETKRRADPDYIKVGLVSEHQNHFFVELEK